jgi:two-component sensor histidine kinase
MAASNEGNVFASGEQILRLLANIDDVRNITPECSRTLSDALIGVHFLTNLSRIDSRGSVMCSALPQARGMNVGATALFQSARKTMAFAVCGQIISPVTHAPVIGAMLPLRDSAGRFAGAVGLGVNALWLDFILKARDMPKGAVVSVFDREGAIVATNNRAVSKAIFSTMPRPETLHGALESRVDERANTWTFAAAPLVGNNVFVGFAMRESRVFGPTYLGVAMDFMLPVLMVVLAWGGIWFATDRQVTQWIDYLRRVAAAYRGGHYRVRPSLEDAPTEFKLLGDAMKDMAAGIEDRDRSLREALAQKTLQIRETHHRVKNNLQVVMSLLSLQAAQSRAPEVRDALTQAQARINALALVHRNLNQIEDQTSVDLQVLLDELTGQIVDSMVVDRAKISVTVDVPPIRVAGELAVPIALFTVETLVNIFKHAFPSERPTGAVSIRLAARSDGAFCLAIEDNGVGFSAADFRPGIGERLLKVFGRQVRGTVSIDSQPNRGTRVELTFATAGLEIERSTGPVIAAV